MGQASGCCSCSGNTFTREGKECSEQEMLQEVERIIEEGRAIKGALIPILQEIQETFGYLPEVAIRRVSKALNIPFSEVAGVIGFYSFFSTIPRGKHTVRVCLGTACYVRGGKDVLLGLQDHLKIGVGETTADRMFTLEVGRCFGACGLAPVIMIDEDVHQRVKPSKIADILSSYTEAGTGE